MDVPSNITARIELINGVKGRRLITGCTAGGKRSEEKNTPELTHIGTMTALINPDTVCIVFARLAINRPIPENKAIEIN